MCLGRHFEYKMTNKQHKDDLLSDTKDMMKRTNDLPLHPKNMMLIYQRYMLSSYITLYVNSILSWNLTIADIEITWVKRSLDGIVHQYVRSWLEITIAGTLDDTNLQYDQFKSTKEVITQYRKSKED